MGTEGIDQKAVGSSIVSSKYNKPVVGSVPRVGQPAPQSLKQSAGDAPNQSHREPTRFGDWENAGRCIDF